MVSCLFNKLTLIIVLISDNMKTGLNYRFPGDEYKEGLPLLSM